MLNFPLKTLSHLFAKQHSAYLRYSQNCWLALDPIDGMWRADHTGVRVQAARELVEQAAVAARNVNMASTANIDAVLRCAAFEPAMTRKIPTDRMAPARGDWRRRAA